ncbi:MAG: TlpA family protein disulfide reductase [Xanthomonadales bacterium]|nr:TlpA family protein disulfide reductase [Xanthomonadales bacterium]
MKRASALLVLVAVLAAGGGFLLSMMFAPEEPRSVAQAVGTPRAEEMVGRSRPEFRHRDSGGRWVESGDFEGSVLLLNFWATWCAPCVEEMPMLSRLQQDHAASGLKVVGIALDDAERAREFAAAMDLAYPVLLGEADVVLTGRRYGNATGMLPYSVLVDSTGIVRWTHLGALDREALETELARIP